MAQTVMDAMTAAAARFALKPAMKFKVEGCWQEITWGDYLEQVRMTARAFMSLGLQTGQSLTILGDNCPQWFISDLATIFAGGVPAGIYATNSPEQCHYIADNCSAVIAVVENEEQLKKFLDIRNRLPQLKAIMMMNGSSTHQDVYAWSERPHLAEQVSEAELEERIRVQKPDDLCTLIYTSGTTGPPKGVMISHDNLAWTALAASQVMEATEEEHLLSYLPLSHIAEKIVSLYFPMTIGGCSWFAESMEKLGENLQEVRPTVFAGVPRVWEKIQAKMVAAGSSSSFIRKMIVRWARNMGLEGGYGDQEGRPRPLLYPLADMLIFSKVKERLGLDRCRYAVTTAAPIAPDTKEFFLSLGIPLLEVYGMSECTGPGTISLPTKFKVDKAGWPLPGTEIKIAEDGEILMRGRHVFKGYYKNEQATRDIIDDKGWLYSGDIGELDDQGFLKITDRKKDLIVTSGGLNIAPQKIEALVKAIPIANQVVILGNNRHFITALITLDPEKIVSTAEAINSPARDIAAAATCPVFNAHLQEQIDAINTKLSRPESIKKFTILPREFTIETGELTPTMKIKRKVVHTHFTSEIEAMYQ